ncbi:M20 metallopeptidase family protein [Intestinimonas butyriciproducens]|uniref:M20 metallopeptidase family protein n=1 Tax=Intestinimonas butyriciproducens TaxID=1297617 RepID=UPI00195B1A11|nr:M20 family metallopeptidase [Intestinimonas butyriciproducens]MBM6917853.1 amidohydrolase [Intestinimonas butyriciproducens]
MNKYLERANQLVPELVENRRHFHRHPEVRNELFETVKYVKAQLEDMGYQVQEICQCGLVVLAGGKKPGKCILIRGDMDALPMPEDTGLEFSSQNPGAMHACGHDLHMAMLLGAAKLLKEHEDEIEGTVKICFQPNEETFGGAKAMIEAGVLENPHVDAAFAIHVGSMADVGTLDYGKGLTMGSADGFSIHVKGKGCHGAAPNSGISPINIGVHIYLALQELLAREVNPAEQCTLTVGSMLFGDGATNVIPSEGVLNGTMRGFNAELINHLRQRVEEISVGTARVFGGDAEVEWLFSSPAMYCDPDFTDEVVRYAADVVGEDRMIPKKSRATGSEDFAYFGEKVPSQIFWLGAGVDDKTKRISNHNPKVLFSEDALPYGAAVYTQCAIQWLKEHK